MITPQNMGTSYVLYAEYEMQEPDSFMKAMNDTGMAPTVARMHNKRLPVVAWSDFNATFTPLVVHGGRMVQAAAVDGFGAFLGLVVADKVQEVTDKLPHIVPLFMRVLEAQRAAQEPVAKKRRGKRVSA